MYYSVVLRHGQEVGPFARMGKLNYACPGTALYGGNLAI